MISSNFLVSSPQSSFLATQSLRRFPATDVTPSTFPGGRAHLNSLRCEATAAPAAASSSSTLYDVLGIPSGASVREIKAAYRRLARACHPDVSRKAGAAAEFMRVHEAYTTLSDPQKRAEYDCKLMFPGAAAGGGERRQATSPPRRCRRPLYSSMAYSGGSRLMWETDQCFW